MSSQITGSLGTLVRKCFLATEAAVWRSEMPSAIAPASLRCGLKPSRCCAAAEDDSGLQSRQTCGEGHLRQLIPVAGHTSMRSQMAAAVGRLAGLGCRHSSMSADTTAGPSSGTSMSLQRHAPGHTLHTGHTTQLLASLAVEGAPTELQRCRRGPSMPSGGQRCNRDSPELAANGHLMRADLPATGQGQH